jgi:hypothetical protein
MLVLNVLGAALYFFLVRGMLLALPDGDCGDGTTGVTYFAILVLICAPFLVLNLTWGAFILAYRYWQGGRFWLLAALVWVLGHVIIMATNPC